MRSHMQVSILMNSLQTWTTTIVLVLEQEQLTPPLIKQNFLVEIVALTLTIRSMLEPTHFSPYLGIMVQLSKTTLIW